MSGHATLSAATQDRKARLAQLKSLKRKAPSVSNDEDATVAEEEGQEEDAEKDADALPSTSKYLSGRNYDAATRGPKLGFETQPSEGVETVESRAAAIAASVAEQQQKDAETQDKPLDLFKLQPKKPNWDLKRDLDRKLEILNVRTDNAIARLVRERIERSREAEAAASGGADTNGQEAIGMQGNTLVEATREMEREQELEKEAEEEED